MSSLSATENGQRSSPDPPTGASNRSGSAAAALPAHDRSWPAPVSPVSLVIPAKNEARNLAWVFEQIPAWVDEVILVDGSSTDATLEMAVACRPDIRIVHQPRPGKGAALRAGFAAASGEIIAMVDADGSMSPGELARFVHLLEGDYDFVKGSRFVAGGGSLDMTRFRKAGNKGLMLLVSLLFGERLTDLCYGFMAFRRRYLPHLALQADGFEIETEMVLRAIRAGLRIAEVPSLELPRRSGKSNLHAIRDGLRVLRTVMAERQAVPARAAQRDLATPTKPLEPTPT